MDFYCVNTSYPMDNLLNRSVQTGPPNVRKRRPVFPPAGWSSHYTRQVAHCTSLLSRQPDVMASFSFGACTACTNIWKLWNTLNFCELEEVLCFITLQITSSHVRSFLKLWHCLNCGELEEVRGFILTLESLPHFLNFHHVFSWSA